MKHSCTACQMCAPVSIGEMSVSLPPFEIFSPKKEMETLFACTGEGAREGSGRLLVEMGGGRGSEDVHIWICSMGTFTGEKMGRGPVWIYWQEEDREVTASRKVPKGIVNSVT